MCVVVADLDAKGWESTKETPDVLSREVGEYAGNGDVLCMCVCWM